MEGIDPRFGLEMKRLREAKGISQRKLGEIVGLDSGYISRIERGEFKPPSEEKIVAIADALAGNRDYMLSLSGKVASDVMNAVKKQPEKLSEAIRGMDNLGEWVGVASVLLLLFALASSARGNTEEDTRKKWLKLMIELRKETEKLPKPQQIQVINYIRKLMDSWEVDVLRK